jgi:hypothetical protein
VFIVHGIGSVCDIKFRTIAEVVDGFRELSNDMSQKHFQSAHLSGNNFLTFLKKAFLKVNVFYFSIQRKLIG